VCSPPACGRTCRRDDEQVRRNHLAVKCQVRSDRPKQLAERSEFQGDGLLQQRRPSMLSTKLTRQAGWSTRAVQGPRTCADSFIVVIGWFR